MLKSYLTKFTVDILPSVAATVIGAYIVNHYIVSKPGADAPVPLRYRQPIRRPEAKAEAKSAPDAKPAETTAEAAIAGRRA